MKNSRILKVIMISVITFFLIANIQPYHAEETNERTEMIKLLASDGAGGDDFGYSVSIDGEYALIGSPDDDSGIGAVYVFEKNEAGNWTESAKLIASDGSVYTYFGQSVCFSGDYAVISAPGFNSFQGSAYVFKKDGNDNWIEEVKLIASDGEAGDSFADSVGIAGDYVIIGSSSHQISSYKEGSAYIYKTDGMGTWTEGAKLTASDGSINNFFGHSVSITDEYALIGAYGDDIDSNNNVGSAYVFKKDTGGTWIQEAKLTASDGASNDHFGRNVCNAGDYALIGAPEDDYYRGSAYIFKTDGMGNWVQEEKLTASDGAASEYFGKSVSIDGEYALIGAEGDDSYQGSAYVFQSDGMGNWVQEAKLIASDGAENDRFGSSVSLESGYALIGAPWDNPFGSAYVYKYNEPPNVNFSWNPYFPTIDDIVNFTDYSTDSDGTIYTWYWDFGDGYYSDLQHPNYQYQNQGYYTITLTVTDDKGIENSLSKEILVSGFGIDQSVFDRGFPIRHAADGDWAAAQSFTPILNTFGGAEIYMHKFGTPEFNLSVELRTDHPQGTLLDTLTFAPEDIPIDWDWLTLDFSDTPIVADTSYFIVCPPAPSGVTTSFGYEWGYAFGDQYDGGAFWFTRDGGSLWRDLPTNYEFVFKTYGYN